MSFSWANLSLAKQALKNAQRKIDAVLDIQEEGEDGESSPTENEFPEEASAESSITQQPGDPVIVQPSGTVEEHVDYQSEAAASENDAWGREWRGHTEHSHVIVDAEPNPIHDAVPHTNSGLLNHSPNSNSPDEAEAEDHHEDRLENAPHEPNSIVIPSSVTREDDEFATIPLSPPHDEGRSHLSRRSSRHEDQMTVASSDIEVIRNIDAWSMASSAQKIAPPADHIPLPTPKLSDSVDTLRGQLRHHEQRIDELTASNGKLTETNSQLQQRIVALNAQEKTLRKDIEKKEEERKDILDEGKRMSDYSAKQSREIRRMKTQVADVDKIKAERKKYKDEKASADETIESLREEIAHLNEKINSAERDLQGERNDKSANVLASEHHKNQHEESVRRIADLEEKQLELEVTIRELTERNEEAGQQLSSLAENELSNRIASERAHESSATAFQELDELRRKNEHLRGQVNEWEQKMERMIEEKSHLAEAVARANVPLLAEIEDLKTSLSLEQSSSDERDKVEGALRKQIQELQKEVARLNESASVAHERSSTEQSHFLQKLTRMEDQIESLRCEHAAEIASAREQNKRISTELEDARHGMEHLREEADAVRAVASNMETSQGELRAQLSEARARIAEFEEKESGDPSEQLPNISEESPHRRHVTFKREAAEFEQSEGHGATLTSSAIAVESERSLLMRNQDHSLRRISELETSLRGNEQAVEARDAALKELRAKYKELDFQYNSLLELDGERLEKIDELQNDILDLRQLLKEQLIAFAEARGRDEES